MSYNQTIPAIVFVLGLVFSTAIAADETAAYRQGIAAFKATNYPVALQYFQQAEQEGLDSVTLKYNLGATHYRLGNYQESVSYFSAIRNHAKWGALAEYNLGLVAERQNKTARAIQHYRQAYRKSDSERVRKLAQGRLGALSDSAALRGADNWIVYLSGAVGSDDNPALAQDFQEPPAPDADTFLEIIGSISGYLSGGPEDGVRLSAGLYSRQYSDVSEFSVSGIDTGIFLDDQTDNWRFTRGVRANNYWIDGNQYSTGGSLVLQATQLGKSVNLDIENDLGFLSGGSNFGFISGIRNRLNIDIFQRQAAGEWRIGYCNEYNDRDDLTTADDQFFSYSPMRHSVYGQLRRSFAQQWSLRARLEYRYSQYADSNRETDAETGVVTEVRREEDRFDASALLRYSMNKTFSVFAEYRYTDNDTNFDRFTYQSNQLMLGVDTLF